MRMKPGYTLVEILIVVIILSILAGMVIPRVVTASDAARHSMLADDLRAMRTQLMVFKWQHNGIPPGYPVSGELTPNAGLFENQITMATSRTRQTAAPGTDGYPYGPYMTQMPENPVNAKTTVKMIPADQSMPTEASDAYGWLFHPSTMDFRADSAGSDQLGKAFIEY